MLQSDNLVARIGFDTAGNEPLEICYSSMCYALFEQAGGGAEEVHRSLGFALDAGCRQLLRAILIVRLKVVCTKCRSSRGHLVSMFFKLFQSRFFSHFRKSLS